MYYTCSHVHVQYIHDCAFKNRTISVRIGSEHSVSIEEAVSLLPDLELLSDQTRQRLAQLSSVDGLLQKQASKHIGVLQTADNTSSGMNQTAA